MSKGFTYDLEDEKIREYMKLSTDDKLRWLEEIAEFTMAALGERERRFRELLRSGEADLTEDPG
ncbi:MAG: hypothetical protein AB1714_25190 [Acidobacteriota bacterium]